jgi:hypothetical protein
MNYTYHDSCHLVCNNHKEQLSNFSKNIVVHFAKVFFIFPAVLQIRIRVFFYPRSRILNFSIPDPGFASKNLSILAPKMVSRHSET